MVWKLRYAMAVAAVMFGLLAHLASALAENRIALIVTNQDYTQPGARLTNPHRDGDLMKAALEKVGFQVTVVRDTRNEGELLTAIGEHVERMAKAGPDAVGLLYYSGHGAADRPDGANYLIPTEAPLTTAAQLPLMAVRLDKITSALSGVGRMSFVVFDACRNVPLQRGIRDLTFKGFAPVREQNGLLVAFATDPGNVAVDENHYAKALSEELVRPGLEAAQVFRRVRQKVRDGTSGKQLPEYLDKRNDDFYFSRRFRDCPTCPEMVIIPPGTFTMGSSPAEIGLIRERHQPSTPHHFDRETPEVRVSIASSLAVGRTHITRGEFAEFVRETSYSVPNGCHYWSIDSRRWQSEEAFSWLSPGFQQDDTHPVVCVSWFDAQAYAEWLSKRTGKHYRLLSEAEIEYASRAVTTPSMTLRYFFGKDADQICGYANVGDLTTAEALKRSPKTAAQCRDGYAFTSPVASYKQNNFGLHDVIGNAWTWTLDCWSDRHTGNPANGSARQSSDCNARAIRGGSWQWAPPYTGSAMRIRNTQNDRVNQLGFRVGTSTIVP